MTGLRWEDGVPVSEAFDDPYYSRADGLAETHHVFLDGCGLPQRWQGRDRFCIAELGFGTGLNFCAAWHLWQETGTLDFVSFERFPLGTDAIDRSLNVWPEITAERKALIAAWSPEGGMFDFGSARLRVIVGDARETLPGWDGTADAWFLDGFAPARNPEMWEPALLRAVAAKSAPGACLATYSAAGAVRRALAEAGFAVEKRAGFGTKREMVTAHLSNCEDLTNDV